MKVYEFFFIVLLIFISNFVVYKIVISQEQPVRYVDLTKLIEENNSILLDAYRKGFITEEDIGNKSDSYLNKVQNLLAAKGAVFVSAAIVMGGVDITDEIKKEARQEALSLSP